MVDINRVYEKVLFLANKEQRGYITPDEFNSYAHEAQLEVFESYFLKKFQVDQAPMNETDYADIAMNVEEKISVFHANTAVTETNNIYTYPTDFYRLTNVTVNGRICDEVMHNKLTYINLSPLTAPTVAQPVMTRQAGGVRIYPDNLGTAEVRMDYLREPATPRWAFMMDPNMAPVYDATNSTQFELHPSDEQELVYKILYMAGITIKQPDVTQFGFQKDAELRQTEG